MPWHPRLDSPLSFDTDYEVFVVRVGCGTAVFAGVGAIALGDDIFGPVRVASFVETDSVVVRGVWLETPSETEGMYDFLVTTLEIRKNKNPNSVIKVTPDTEIMIRFINGGSQVTV